MQLTDFRSVIFPWILLSALVIAAALNWLACRHGIRRNASSVVFSACSSGVAMVVAGLLALFQHQSSLDAVVVGLAVVCGTAGAIGWISSLYCLKIGPTGPTVLVTNLGLVWPVAVSLIWFRDRPDRLPLTILGIILAIVALVLLGTDRREDVKLPISLRWMKYALVTWIGVGVIGICTLLVGRCNGEDRTTYVTMVYAVQTVALLVVAVIRRSRLLERKVVVMGVVSGFLTAFESIVLLVVLASLPAEIVFPATVVVPLILILLVGNYLLGEKMNRRGWTACALGIVGIVVLSV